jgi:hypothetical protein
LSFSLITIAGVSRFFLTVETVGVAEIRIDLFDAFCIAALDFVVDQFESLYYLAVE